MSLLIAVPLLSLLVTAAIGYIALDRASVRGDEYKQLKSAQDLRADVTPPAASLLGPAKTVNYIAVLAASSDFIDNATQSRIQRKVAEVSEMEQRYREAIDRWLNDDSTIGDSKILKAQALGDQFYRLFNEQLRANLAAQNSQAALATARQMELVFIAQDSVISDVIALSENEVANREARVDDFVGRTSWVLLAAAAVLSLFALIVAAMVRRSIVRPIRALTERARSVAADELPNVVNQVQNLGSDEALPHLAAFEIDSHDELAELASSFSAVQNTAVDLAIEQAQARRIVSDNLVNLGRRNQSLLSRTLGFISDLEENERDPDNLENLFRLDHLTTRMRRNAQSLLVLAGAQPTRKWSPAVLIGDVVRAALSEIESYEQVDVSDLGDVMIQGSVAAEVAHLLAELLENATSFSPPNSKVHVVGRSVPNGYQVAVIDYGLGMSADDLGRHNRQLAEVTSFDQTSSKMLGFQVVARLAARHGIRTVLAETPGKMGVTAIVNLPDAVFDSTSTHVPSSMVAAQGPAPRTTVTDADLAALVASESAASPEVVASAPEFAMPPSGAPARDLPDPVLAPPLGEAAPVADSTVALRPGMPTLAAVGAMTGPFVDHTPSAVAAGPKPVGAEGVAPVLPQFDASSMATAGGLSRRVKGAQMPDMGAAATATTFDRPADEVRGALSSLQAGLDRVRLAGARPTGPVPISEPESKG